MSNREMRYIGEREDSTFTIPSGGVYTYTFTDTYRRAQVTVDDWDKRTKPAVTNTNTEATITGVVGAKGKITVRESN